VINQSDSREPKKESFADIRGLSHAPKGQRAKSEEAIKLKELGVSSVCVRCSVANLQAQIRSGNGVARTLTGFT
jgi:hypothetical protein